MSPAHLIANRYRIADPERDLLGRGAMGDVYGATDTQTGETVAVKALNPDVLARDPHPHGKAGKPSPSPEAFP
jgi:hypothetical protein